MAAELAGPVIHPSAVVSPDAVLGRGVVVGPHCVIGERVQIGEGTEVGPSTLIEGPTVIGAGNRITGHASIGTDPQDLKFHGEETFLTIGDDNWIREFVTLNRGTGAGTSNTRIGSHNLIMTGVHVAHDCVVGDHTILENAATLAGHVDVGDYATVGAFTGVHQFCNVGPHAFIGGYSVLTRDALPFIKTVGSRNDAKTYGVNTIGLERKGFSKVRIEALQAAYRVICRRGPSLAASIRDLRESPNLTSDVEILLNFVEASRRGFVR